MRGVWLENLRASYRTDIPVPQPGPGEALVRVIKAGICHTDIELMRGYYPYTGVIGHEFVGVVEQADDAAWIGKRVCGEINVVCGECEQCRAGRSMHCERRTVLGIVARSGALAEYLALPVANLHEVPPNVTDDEAVFAEPLAAAVGILDLAPVAPADRVLVIGPGKLGNLVAQVLALTGADLLVVGRRPAPLELLARRGIRTGALESVAERRADVVVECSGNPAGLELARKAVRPRGTIILKSTYAGDTTINMSSIVVDEVRLVGSRCGPMDAALRLLEQRAVDVRPLIECRYPLARVLDALAEADQPGRMKVLVEM
ncbi:MAG: alcohol dehydrogenase catalytic domain-containing protein [Anaerolineae bacterium]|nr:alcohol dehydrogenase catalytic domain-containing protein [Anaerolineae bacterium]